MQKWCLQQCIAGLILCVRRPPRTIWGGKNVNKRSGVQISSFGTYSRNAHLISCQCTSLVATNHVRASESLHTRKVTDDGVFLGHFFRTKSQAGGNDSGQTFRDGSDSKSYRNFEVVNCTLQSTMMCWIPEMAEVDHPDKDAYNRNDFRQLITKFIQFALQGSLFRDLFCYRFVNVPNRRFCTCVDNNGLRVPIDNGCSLR